MVLRRLFRGRVLPSHWYNIQPDLPFKLPPLINSRTGFPVGPRDLEHFLAPELVDQELNTRDREVRIPDEVLEYYEAWRPTPVVRAERLEEALGTPARIFYKYEGRSPCGSHESNTAYPQAYYSKRGGANRLVTGTGEAEWGSALAMAGAAFRLGVLVFLVRAAARRNPHLEPMLRLLQAETLLSPSDTTRAGRRVLQADPQAPGSLGMAISEAVEVALEDAKANCCLSTVLGHVVLHQTVIGLEARSQMEQQGVYPDVVIGSAGGGTSFAGLVLPFVRDRLHGRNIRFVAAEPAEVPSLTRGTYAYDYADAEGLFPLLKMHTVGHRYLPPLIEAESMRYHGMAPVVSALVDKGYIEAVSCSQRAVMESAVLFARTESLIVGPAAAYGLHAAVLEALRCKETGEARTVLFGINSHGNFKLDVYEAFLRGEIADISPDESSMREAMKDLPSTASSSTQPQA